MFQVQSKQTEGDGDPPEVRRESGARPRDEISRHQKRGEGAERRGVFAAVFD